jgi:hypothetical protein
LPIRDEDRRRANHGFHRLEKLLGRRRMLEAKVIEPTAEDFPDPYDKSSETVEMLFFPAHEPMTDLLTVFLGLGIFTANSAARFQQFQND